MNASFKENLTNISKPFYGAVLPVDEAKGYAYAF